MNYCLSGVGLALVLTASVAQAQSRFDQPRGAERSEAAISGGAGYRYVAPSYRIGLAPGAYGGYGNYYGFPRTPAYRYTTRVPYFSHIQPWYQTSYYSLFGYGVPALGAQPSNVVSTRPGPGYFLNPRAYAASGRGVRYHPYTTVSQFLYTPTYTDFSGPAYPATLGAYGFSMYYGY